MTTTTEPAVAAKRSRLPAILSGTAAALSLAALALAVQGGPAGKPGAAGPRGPQGSTGASATASHLGICWEANYQTDSGGLTYVNGVSVSQALNTSGVFTCPQGMTFVPITPGKPTIPTGTTG